MNASPPKLLLTGSPGCGKTTLIKRLASSLDLPFHGFFTAEIRQGGRRVGFEIESFDGHKAVMSHAEIRSAHKVGKYGVDLEAFEKTALPSIRAAIDNRELLIIDEIGKMELSSSNFRSLILKAFDSEIPLVATIMSHSHPFCDRLKNRPLIKILELTRSNQQKIYREIARLL